MLYVSVDENVKVETKLEVKQEKIMLDKQIVDNNAIKPPPEKKPKLIR